MLYTSRFTLYNLTLNVSYQVQSHLSFCIILEAYLASWDNIASLACTLMISSIKGCGHPYEGGEWAEEINRWEKGKREERKKDEHEGKYRNISHYQKLVMSLAPCT